MALFKNQLHGSVVALRPLHTFGRRASVCQTVMAAPDVSQVHALVRWNRQTWEIVDQSRNGTEINGVRLATGRWTALTEGARLRMGMGDESVWTVVDLAPPVTCLYPSDGQGPPLVLSPRGNLLPDSQEPEANVFFQDGRWLMEAADDTQPLADGATVQTSRGRWEFVLCDDLELTREIGPAAHGPGATDVFLRFEVSQNEEHASLSLLVDGKTLALGERIHHYTLVTLARLRQQDAAQGVPAPSQGWVEVEELARMLGVDASYVNIQIFRAKHQILGALPQAQATPLVERRRGSLRFGEHRFDIQGGALARNL
jgi:hypothetical protein